MNQAERSTKLQALVDKAVQKDALVKSAVLGVVHPKSGFTWSGAAGHSDEAGRTPMTPETPFFVASITKLYTSVAVQIMQERGLLQLDDPIAKHLPASLIQGLHTYKGTDYVPQITIRHLVSMTAGLADYSLQAPKGGKPFYDILFTEGDRAFSKEEIARLVREELTPYFPPGAPGKAHYSDTGYLLLGAILEAVSGQPIDALFAELFFNPLGLTQTCLRSYPSLHPVAEPATFYYKERPGKIDLAMKTIAPQGGIVSTVAELIRFLQAVTQGELFANKSTFASMQQWNRIFFPMQYGLGMMRFTMSRLMSPFMPVPELLGHSGSTASFLYYSPERDLYLAGTLNQIHRQRQTFPLMIQAANLFR